MRRLQAAARGPRRFGSRAPAGPGVSGPPTGTPAPLASAPGVDTRSGPAIDEDSDGQGARPTPVGTATDTTIGSGSGTAIDGFPGGSVLAIMAKMDTTVSRQRSEVSAPAAGQRRLHLWMLFTPGDKPYAVRRGPIRASGQYAIGRGPAGQGLFILNNDQCASRTHTLIEANLSQETLLLERASEGQLKELPADFIELLLLYDWPRNVREVHKVANHLRLFGPDVALQDRLKRPAAPAEPEGSSAPEDAAPDPDDGPRPRKLPPPKKEQLEALMAKHRGVILEVANELGCSRRQIGRWLDGYQIDRLRYRGE